ncbi:hypothetical protein BP6252_07149 [Coleophoma cylindrospora]|uniref:Rhodopsin domain-containing protein n=1 Tax=Coleophoma cylindrospora TaxID=1849047 RepID=A0A3D8RGS6_9HELO|nr:hypothetical protein BP6252_07149 [Coleophoma cylindrospora]
MSNTTDPYLAAYLEALMAAAATQDMSQDLRASTRNLSIVFSVLALLFVGFRFWARFKQAQKIGMDDWLMVASVLFLAGNLACSLVLVDNGIGLHSGALTLNQAVNIGKILLINEPLYVININLIKISLLCLYFRIFPLRVVKLGAYILGGISTAWMIGLLGFSQGQCIPYKKNFYPWVPGTCINHHTVFLAISVPSILTDIAILGLPLPHVWRLQTNLSQRLSLCFIFLLGSFVTFCSIYRFVVYIGYNQTDPSYTLAPGIAWNVVEISSGIISACLPTLGPLVRVVFKSVMPSTLGSKSNKQKYGSSGLSNLSQKDNRSRSQSWNRLGEDAKYGASGLQTQVTIARAGGAGSDDGSDEIPLTAIRQERHIDVEWSQQKLGNALPVQTNRV